MKRMCLTFLLILALAVPAMGKEITLVLDWFPNVDHIPLYVAQQKGYFDEEGLEVKMIPPSESADALKLAAAGRAELGISYEPQALVAASEEIPLLVSWADLLAILFPQYCISKDAASKNRRI